MTKEQFREERQFVALLDLCLGACHRVAKHDSEMRETLKRLYRTNAEISQELRPTVHSSKRVKGHTWVDGKKEPLT